VVDNPDTIDEGNEAAAMALNLLDDIVEVHDREPSPAELTDMLNHIQLAEGEREVNDEFNDAIEEPLGRITTDAQYDLHWNTDEVEYHLSNDDEPLFNDDEPDNDNGLGGEGIVFEVNGVPAVDSGHDGDSRIPTPDAESNDNDSNALPIEQSWQEQLRDVLSERVELFPDAGEDKGDGETALDRFWADKHANKRYGEDGILYFPFASKDEWELASALDQLSISIGDLDMVLKTKIVRAVCIRRSRMDTKLSC
jgi:hypothetical protein